MKSGYKLRRTDRDWHQWEMACITDSDIENGKYTWRRTEFIVLTSCEASLQIVFAPRQFIVFGPTFRLSMK